MPEEGAATISSGSTSDRSFSDRGSFRESYLEKRRPPTTQQRQQQSHQQQQQQQQLQNQQSRQSPSQPQQPQSQSQQHDEAAQFDGPFSASDLSAAAAALARRCIQLWRTYINTTAPPPHLLRKPRLVLALVGKNLLLIYHRRYFSSSRRKLRLSLIALCCLVLSVATLWRSTSAMDGYYYDDDRRRNRDDLGTLPVPLGRAEAEAAALAAVGLRPVSKHRRGRVLYCGWAQHRHLFPDYDPPLEWSPEYLPHLTEHDVLLYSMNQHKRKDPACDGFQSADPQDLLDVFPGRILYVNGESYTVALGRFRPVHAATGRIFQIGAFPKTPNNGGGGSSGSGSSGSSLRDAAVANRTMAVTYMALYHMRRLAHPGVGFEPALLDAARPVNTGRHRDGVAYFTSKCVPHRQEAARNISGVLTVHYGDGCPVEPLLPAEAAAAVAGGNHSGDASAAASAAAGSGGGGGGGGTVHVANQTRQDFKENYLLYHDYPFCLVMENKAHPGYVTEKIFNAYMGGCLPIYYGTAEIYDIFHPDSFVFYDVDDPGPALALLRRLRDDPDEYMRRLADTPMLRDGERTVEEYFSILPTIGDGTLNCRMRAMMGIPPLKKDRRKPCAFGGLWVPPPDNGGNVTSKRARTAGAATMPEKTAKARTTKTHVRKLTKKKAAGTTSVNKTTSTIDNAGADTKVDARDADAVMEALKAEIQKKLDAARRKRAERKKTEATFGDTGGAVERTQVATASATLASRHNASHTANADYGRDGNGNAVRTAGGMNLLRARLEQLGAIRPPASGSDDASEPAPTGRNGTTGDTDEAALLNAAYLEATRKLDLAAAILARREEREKLKDDGERAEASQ